MNIDSLLIEALKQNNITISPIAVDQCVLFLKILTQWNRVFNLTRIETPREMVYGHIIDSLSLNTYLKGTYCLDVGSGGGLPGIPLAMINPQQKWTLLDKNGKKVRFLRQVIAELSLQNVEVIQARCEEFQSEHCFDSITSRAFGSLRNFVSVCAPLLCADGMFFAMKGKYPTDEISDLPKDFIIHSTEALHIKGLDVERHIICIKKRKQHHA